MWPDSLITIPFYRDIGKFIHSIDMSIFMFISGYLYANILFHSDKYNGTNVFLKNKAKRLLIPYILWGGIINVLFIDRYQIKSILFGISHLWFLLALMTIFVIVHLSRKFWMDLHIIKMFALICFFFVVSPLVSKLGLTIFALPSAMYYLPVFFTGIVCAKFSVVWRNFIMQHRKQMQILLGALVVWQFLLCFMDIPKSLCSQSTRFFSIIIIVLVWGLCLGKQWKTLNVIKSLDANSMGIYIIHHILLIYVITNDSMALMMVEHWCLSPIILFVLVSVVSWGLASLINQSRYAMYFFG